MNAFSLFTGAGGLDYGVEAAGFAIRCCLEMDADCCATLRANTSWNILEKDIKEVAPVQMLELAGIPRQELHLLIGGPPCQPFSKAAYWANGDTKRLQDPRASTLTDYMDYVDSLLPEVFLIENVHGLVFKGKSEAISFIERRVQEINDSREANYRISWKLLNSADYGVPQLRTRLFIVGHKGGKEFHFPEPTRSTTGESALITAWDAIGHIEIDATEDLELKGRWADLVPCIPEGKNYLWLTNRGGGPSLFGWRTRYWSFLLKLAKSKPSWTLQASAGPATGPFHWDNRLLSIKEMAALQTFPLDRTFQGGRRSSERQIGNAVPSLLSEVVAREISIQFFNVTPHEPLKHRVELRRPIPPPRPPLDLPAKYSNLIGDHPDHPGPRKKSAIAK